MGTRCPSRLRPTEFRLSLGPVLSWTAEAEFYDLEWLVEVTWNSKASHWSVWLGCEGVFVGAVHLDEAAWGRGSCCIVDPEALLEAHARRTLEAQIDKAFYARGMGERVQSQSEYEVLAFLTERRNFGLAFRLLQQVNWHDPWHPNAIELAGLIAKGIGDEKGVEDAQRSLREHGCDGASFVTRLADIDLPSRGEREMLFALHRKTRDEVNQAIAQAFADANMPGTVAELTIGGIDGPSVVDHFLGKYPNEIALSFSYIFQEDFTYMTPQAVQYYLPCVLQLMTEDLFDDELWIFLNGFLLSPTEAEQRNLTREQQQVISDWAVYLHHEWKVTPYYELVDPNEALLLAKAYRRS